MYRFAGAESESSRTKYSERTRRRRSIREDFSGIRRDSWMRGYPVWVCDVCAHTRAARISESASTKCIGGDLDVRYSIPSMDSVLHRHRGHWRLPEATRRQFRFLTRYSTWEFIELTDSITTERRIGGRRTAEGVPMIGEQKKALVYLWLIEGNSSKDTMEKIKSFRKINQEFGSIAAGRICLSGELKIIIYLIPIIIRLVEIIFFAITEKSIWIGYI